MTQHKSSDERSAQILAAAKRCFLARGYSATRMDEIARAAGLSKGGVYFHFASKQEIFRALVQAEYDASMSFIDAVAKDRGSQLHDKLLRTGTHFVERFAGGENPRLMLIINEMALRDQEIQELLVQIQRSYLDQLESLIAWGVERGELREVDPRHIAFLLKAMVDGIQMAYAIDAPEQIEPTLVAGMDMLMRGLLDLSSDDARHTARSIERALSSS